jgi:hypothetical protein
VAETSSWLSTVDLIAASTATSRIPAIQGLTSRVASSMKTVSGLSSGSGSTAIPARPMNEAPASTTTTQLTPRRRARGMSPVLRMLMKRLRMWGWPK